MGFGGLIRFADDSGGWVVVRRGDPEISELQGEPLPYELAASLVPGWCRDATLWPTMLGLYEVISDQRSWNCNERSVAEDIVPALVRAFETGEVLVHRFPARKREAEAVMAGTSSTPRTPESKSPRVIKQIRELSFVDVQVFSSRGSPLANRKFKLQLPTGAIREGQLDGSGRVRVDDIDPGTGRITLLPAPGELQEGSELPPVPVPASTTPNWIAVRVASDDGQPLASQPLRIELPDGTISEAATDEHGVLMLEEITPGSCRISLPGVEAEAWRIA